MVFVGLNPELPLAAIFIIIIYQLNFTTSDLQTLQVYSNHNETKSCVFGK